MIIKIFLSLLIWGLIAFTFTTTFWAMSYVLDVNAPLIKVLFGMFGLLWTLGIIVILCCFHFVILGFVCGNINNFIIIIVDKKFTFCKAKN